MNICLCIHFRNQFWKLVLEKIWNGWGNVHREKMECETNSQNLIFINNKINGKINGEDNWNKRFFLEEKKNEKQ